MPLYEYYCSECGAEFEKLLSFADPDVNSPECPICSSKNTNKRLSRFASFGSSASTGTANASCGSNGGFR